MSLLDAFTHSRGIMVFVNEWKSYNPIKNIPVGPIHGMETFPISKPSMCNCLLTNIEWALSKKHWKPDLKFCLLKIDSQRASLQILKHSFNHTTINQVTYFTKQNCLTFFQSRDMEGMHHIICFNSHTYMQVYAIITLCS